MAELKPCPFCGGEAEYRPVGFLSDPCGYVKCKNCGVKQYWYSPKKEAIEAWNRRAESEELKFTRDFIHEHGLEFALASAWNRRVEDGK